MAGKPVKSALCAVLICTLFLHSACMTVQQTPAHQVQGGIYTPGVYTASAQGNIGPVTVEVTFSADAIVNVHVIAHEETGVLSAPAIQRIPGEIVDRQTLAVDALAGATYTSDAILEAVAYCVAQAGGAPLSSPSSPNHRKGNPISLNADVVVVGAGVSGMCAAISAAQEGVRVIVVEKLSFVGGSATSSLGCFLALPLGKDEAYNHIATEEAMQAWQALMAKGRPDSAYPDTGRLEDMLMRTQPTLHWLEGMGATFGDSSPSIGGMRKLWVNAQGAPEERAAAKFMRLLSVRAAELGVILLTDVKATSLLQQGDAVTGVVGVSNVREFHISTRNVILACGGFGSSPALVRKLLPEITRVGYYSQSVSTNTGDGLRMAQDAGAAVYDDNWVVPSFIAPSGILLEHNSQFLKLMENNGLPEPYSSYDRLMIDCTGRRFMNEAAEYPEQNISMVNRAAAPYYALYDNPDAQMLQILESGLQTGGVFKGETIEALAISAGVDYEIFAATVARYNAQALAGEDTDFGKDPARMHPIASGGPYYLVQFVCCFTGTLGGVRTDAEFRALREDGGAIPGLYAVGEMANRLYFNRMYLSGASLSFGATMGRVAGKSAANADARHR